MSERELLEQERRDLVCDLQSNSSDIGDWKFIKQTEYLSMGLEPPYTEEEMAAYSEKREFVRERIREIDELLK